MTSETLIIIVIRLLVPLTILRWPLAGGLLALLADALDIVLASLIDLGGLWNYHQLDKYLDTYYLVIEAVVAQRWLELPRWTATGLFGYRLIGFALFEITDIRVFLFVFPNLFENFFLFYAALLRFFPDYELTPRRLAVWLAILLVPKMVQEYVIHYQRWLDDVVAVDVIEDVKDAVLDWLGNVFGSARLRFARGP
ncbi:MAG: hypothetical protein WD939_05250 [Dehalococcoidia bacterium]